MGDRSRFNSAEIADALTSLFSGRSSGAHAAEDVASICAAERRRIAQELHDSAFQILALLQLNLGRLRRMGSEELAAPIAECEELVRQIAGQLRAVCDEDESQAELPTHPR